MKYIFTLFALLFILTQINADAQDLPDSTKKLVVGVKSTPPFIFKNSNDEYVGVSISLWEDIAEELDYEFEYKEYDLDGLIGALKNGEIDVCINPLTVTSKRVEQFDFTQPFYITNLAIAVDKTGQNKWVSFIKKFFSMQFFEAVLLLFIVLMVFGVLVWFFEKDKNSEEFGKGMKGVWNGLWWSAVTMTTVGYGDKSPKTTGGRIVALIWMFTAIIIISGFTASIASSLTVSELETSIKSPKDLKKVSVLGVKSSTGAEYMARNNINYESSSDIQTALTKLNNVKVNAVVYDQPIMRYSIDQLGYDNKVIILPYVFATQYYSFSLPKNSTKLSEINPVLLRHINDVSWKAILQDYNLSQE